MPRTTTTSEPLGLNCYSVSAIEISCVETHAQELRVSSCACVSVSTSFVCSCNCNWHLCVSMLISIRKVYCEIIDEHVNSPRCAFWVQHFDVTTVRVLALCESCERWREAVRRKFTHEQTKFQKIENITCVYAMHYRGDSDDDEDVNVLERPSRLGVCRLCITSHNPCTVCTCVQYMYVGGWVCVCVIAVSVQLNWR